MDGPNQLRQTIENTVAVSYGLPEAGKFFKYLERDGWNSNYHDGVSRRDLESELKRYEKIAGQHGVKITFRNFRIGMGKIDSDILYPDEVDNTILCYENVSSLPELPKPEAQVKEKSVDAVVQRVWGADGDAYTDAIDRSKGSVEVRRHSYEILGYKIPKLLDAIDGLGDVSKLEETISERKGEAAYGVLDELCARENVSPQTIRLFGLNKKSTYDKMEELAENEYSEERDKIKHSSKLRKFLAYMFEPGKALGRNQASLRGIVDLEVRFLEPALDAEFDRVTQES